MPRQILILDSSQISLFDECETKWKLSYGENLTTSNDVREDMAMGTFGHHLLEIYYKDRSVGSQADMAAAHAVDWANKLDGFPLSAEKKATVLNRFQDYWMTYSRKDIEVAMGKPVHRIEQDKIFPDNIIDVYDPNPLVEKGFSYELLNTPDYLFILEGRVDIIGTLSGTLAFMDHKFQGRSHELYQKSIQFRNYSLALDLSLGIINYIRLHKEITKDTLKREIISFPPWERKWWKTELIKIYLRIAERMRSKDFEMNFSACPGKYGFKCEFTKICEEHDLVTIDAIKNQNYKQKEVWTPW